MCAGTQIPSIYPFPSKTLTVLTFCSFFSCNIHQILLVPVAFDCVEPSFNVSNAAGAASSKCSLSDQSGQYYDSEFCTQTGARQACEIQEYLASPRNIIEKIHNITISWYIYRSCMHQHAISVSLQVLPFQHRSRPSHFKRI